MKSQGRKHIVLGLTEIDVRKEPINYRIVTDTKYLHLLCKHNYRYYPINAMSTDAVSTNKFCTNKVFTYLYTFSLLNVKCLQVCSLLSISPLTYEFLF